MIYWEYRITISLIESIKHKLPMNRFTQNSDVTEYKLYVKYWLLKTWFLHLCDLQKDFSKPHSNKNYEMYISTW